MLIKSCDELQMFNIMLVSILLMRRFVCVCRAMSDIKDLSSTAIYAWTTLISVLICVPGALIFEGAKLRSGIDLALQKDPNLYFSLLLVGLLYHLYNQVNLLLLLVGSLPDNCNATRSINSQSHASVHAIQCQASSTANFCTLRQEKSLRKAMYGALFLHGLFKQLDTCVLRSLASCPLSVFHCDRTDISLFCILLPCMPHGS